MGNKRHKILHLRGTKNLTIEHANELNFENGEIAIKHGNNGESKLYVLTQDGNNIDSFVTKTYIDNVTNNITNDIIENEEVVATALTNLDNRLLDVESGTSVVFNEYVKKNEITKIATTGSYNDLTNKPTIPAEVTETTISNWGFTKNTGTYSKPNGGIPKSDLDSAVQTSLGKADTALQSYTEQYKGTITGISANGTSIATSGVANIPAASTSTYGVTKLSSSTNSTSTTEAATPSAVKTAYDLANSYKGTVTGVKINGTTKNPSSGVVNLGTVITSHQDISGKQDKLVSGTNIKTVNGESILGEGNIVISSSMPLYEQGSTNSISVYPNVYTRFQYSIYSLTIYLNPGYEIEGQLNEYLIEFQVGANDATISFPDTVIWENGIYPTFEANCTYQISIVNNLGVVKKFGI